MCFLLKTKHTFELEIEDDDVSSIRISSRTTHKHSRPSTPPSFVATMPTYIPSQLLPPSGRPEDHYNVITYSAPGYTYPTPTITYGAPAAPRPDNAATALKIAEILVSDKPATPSYTTNITNYNTYKNNQSANSAAEYQKATKEYLEAELQVKRSEQQREQEREEVFRSRLAAPESHPRRARSVSVSSRRERSTTRLVIEQEVRKCRDCGSERHRTRECTRNLAPVGTLVVLPAASGHRRSRSAASYREHKPESAVRYISYGDY